MSDKIVNLDDYRDDLIEEDEIEDKTNFETSTEIINTFQDKLNNSNFNIKRVYVLHESENEFGDINYGIMTNSKDDKEVIFMLELIRCGIMGNKLN